MGRLGSNSLSNGRDGVALRTLEQSATVERFAAVERSAASSSHAHGDTWWQGCKCREATRGDPGCGPRLQATLRDSREGRAGLNAKNNSAQDSPMIKRRWQNAEHRYYTTTWTWMCILTEPTGHGGIWLRYNTPALTRNKLVVDYHSKVGTLSTRDLPIITIVLYKNTTKCMTVWNAGLGSMAETVQQSFEMRYVAMSGNPAVTVKQLPAAAAARLDFVRFVVSDPAKVYRCEYRLRWGDGEAPGLAEKSLLMSGTREIEIVCFLLLADALALLGTLRLGRSFLIVCRVVCEDGREASVTGHPAELSPPPPPRYWCTLSESSIPFPSVAEQAVTARRDAEGVPAGGIPEILRQPTLVSTRVCIHILSSSAKLMRRASQEMLPRACSARGGATPRMRKPEPDVSTGCSWFGETPGQQCDSGRCNSENGKRYCQSRRESAMAWSLRSRGRGQIPWRRVDFQHVFNESWRRSRGRVYPSMNPSAVRAERVGQRSELLSEGWRKKRRSEEGWHESEAKAYIPYQRQPCFVTVISQST
ncbi:hypothetical protein C8R45DRAFT_943045 [Mycena sanguinolenta]|nr:hypothetical protein C8R45DRAFT_943045 [Mycena sanguinolenta]